MTVADLHEQARKDFAAGAAHRDPARVRAAANTARDHGSESAQAGGGRRG